MNHEIQIRQAVIHILDSMKGEPVLSDVEINFGSEFADFLKYHIGKILLTDDSKSCRFYEQSEIYQLLKEYSPEKFIDCSQRIAQLLYAIMNSNIDIPAGDLIVTTFRAEEEDYIAILKMNYKEFYTHRSFDADGGTGNDIVRHNAILPNRGQKLTEAAVIRLKDCAIWLIEKKYEVNGEKVNYFSYLFLKCSSTMSQRSRLNVISRAIESVKNDFYGEDDLAAEKMEAKRIINDILEEQGNFHIEELADRIFGGEPEQKVAFQEKMEKYDLVKEKVEPQSDRTKQRYQRQHLRTDTGIELSIPMDQYKNPESVQFITNEDGTTSVIIKNAGKMTVK